MAAKGSYANIYVDYKYSYTGTLAQWTHFYTSPDNTACAPYDCVVDDNGGGTNMAQSAIVDEHNGNIKYDWTQAGVDSNGFSSQTFNIVCTFYKSAGVAVTSTAGTWLYFAQAYCNDCTRKSGSSWNVDQIY